MLNYTVRVRVIFKIPPAKHLAPKIEKLDLDMKRTFETTFRVRVRVRVMLRCTPDLTMIQVGFIQMDD